MLGLYGGYLNSTGRLAAWSIWKLRFDEGFDYTATKTGLSGIVYPDWWAWWEAEKSPRDILGVYPSNLPWAGKSVPTFATLQDIQTQIGPWLDSRTSPVAVYFSEEVAGPEHRDLYPKIASWLHRDHPDVRPLLWLGHWYDPADMPVEYAHGLVLDYFAQIDPRQDIVARFDQYSRLGKPVTLLVWASGPHYDVSKRRYPSAQSLIDGEWWQIPEALSRGWDVALYCRASTTGGIDAWMSNQDPEASILRRRVFHMW